MIKWALITVLVVVTPISGIASGENDQHVSRRLVEQGKILPLQQILVSIDQQRVGRVLEVELELVRGRYIYAIELLGEDGRVLEYEVDASSGERINRKLEE